MKGNKIIILLGSFFALGFSNCRQVNTTKNSPSVIPEDRPESVLKLNTFSTFPPEIEGCSCYFSNDSLEFKEGNYIYMNDYGTTSFLKINGVLTRFNQTDYKVGDDKIKYIEGNSEKYKFELEIIDVEKNGDETSLKKGTIILFDKKGNKIIKTFYGECGC